MSDKVAIQEKAAAFSAALTSVLPRLAASSPSVVGRSSAVDAMLLEHRDEILGLLDKGYAPGTIARVLADADAEGRAFAVETIRLAIVRLRDRAERERDSGPAKRRFEPRVEVVKPKPNVVPIRSTAPGRSAAFSAEDP